MDLTIKMKSIHILITFILFLSCSPSEDNAQENEAFKTIVIDFARVKAQVPVSYVRTNLDEYESMLLESDREQALKDIDLRANNNLKSIPVKTQLYLDSTNYGNHILFQEGEHVKLTKELVGQYLHILNKQLEQSWGEAGLHYELQDKRFFSNREAQVIKIKFKVSYNDFQKYVTQYIISGRAKTIGVFSSTIADTDADELMKRIQIN